MVTSSPSRIQTVPRPITTSQCHLAQGNRSSRAGMSVVIRPVSTPDDMVALPCSQNVSSFVTPLTLIPRSGRRYAWRHTPSTVASMTDETFYAGVSEQARLLREGGLRA